MTQVKIFAGDTVERAEERINEWLAERKLISIVDIKWSSCAATTSNNLLLTRYSALVIYQCQSEE